MPRLFDVRNVHVSINRPAGEVYTFMSDGQNLGQWATGLGSTYVRDGDSWLVQGPDGLVRARLPNPNEFGVVDHTVTLPTGVTAYIPIRVIPNGDGSTITVTVLRRDGVSDEQFDADAQWVSRDLATLKSVLEGRR